MLLCETGPKFWFATGPIRRADNSAISLVFLGATRPSLVSGNEGASEVPEAAKCSLYQSSLLCSVRSCHQRIRFLVFGSTAGYFIFCYSIIVTLHSSSDVA